MNAENKELNNHAEPQGVHALHKLPPCQNACPIDQDAREYINLIAQDRLDDAARLIRSKNPLSGICGRVCAHPCENDCRRGAVDQPISIRRLKRYVMEYALNPYPLTKTKEPRGKKVAIIGSGPAGLTAAHDLALEGYEVTVFEKSEDFGGSVRWGVPSYRLPIEVIHQDVDAISKMGVVFKNKMALGRDFTIQSLEEDGFAAVLLATGLTESRSLPIPNGDHVNVLTALPFLRSVKENEAMVDPGDEVVVIGSGDVAMDVTRTARRMGVEKVHLACLEKWDEMPASSLEKREALEEGVDMEHTGWGPKAVLVDENDSVTGLECKKCVSVFNEHGQFNPQYDEQNVAVIPGNRIIFAIGQYSSLNYLQLMGIQLDERGRLIFDGDTGMTTRQGVFSCGEVSKGPGLLVDAMANGRSIASNIHAFLSGETVADLREGYEALEPLSETVIRNIREYRRQAPSVEPVSKRVDNFDEVELGFSPDEASAEIRRCLNCGTGAAWKSDRCAFCLNCVRVCPYEVPQLDEHGQININPEQCQACGLCYSLCPGCTVAFGMKDVTDLTEEIREMAESVKDVKASKKLVLYCYYSRHDYMPLEPKLAEDGFHVASIGIPCVGKIRKEDVFEALDLGFDKMLIVGCDEKDCTHPESSERIHSKVTSLTTDLEEIGTEKSVIFRYISALADEVAGHDDAI